MKRLLIHGARVLLPDATAAPHRDILVEDGRIAALLAPGTPVEDAPTTRTPPGGNWSGRR